MSYREKTILFSFVGMFVGAFVLLIIGGETRIRMSDYLFALFGTGIFGFVGLLITGMIIRIFKIGPLPAGVKNSDSQLDQLLDVPELDGRPVADYKYRGNSFILAAFLVLLVGASSCFGGFTFGGIH